MSNASGRKGPASATRQSVAIDEDLKQDITKIKLQLDNVATKDDLTTLATGLVKTTDLQKLVTQIVKEMRENLEKDLERKISEKTSKLRQEMDELNLHNFRLQESLQDKQKEIEELKRVIKERQCEEENVHKEMRKEMTEVRKMAVNGIRKGNYNEQYSRRNNIKVMDFAELEDEDEENNRDIVRDFCKEVNKKISGTISPDDLLAVHRIPGRDITRARPLVVKFVRKDVRNHVIRHKKELRETMKLVDDVTRDNAGLINRLKCDSRIENAWYFNGRVFAVCDGVKKPVDLYDTVDDVFKGK